MDLTKRQKEIYDFVSSQTFASIREISEKIFISGATVRREIKKMEEKGFLKSFYGGVVLTEYENKPVPIYLRDHENSLNKEKIAVKAAELIEDHQTVIFDASSTVRRICRHIKNRKGLTVITNNLRVCEELKDSAVRVVCTGGTLIQKRECFVGHFAEEFIGRVHADLLFFSSQGLSQNGDITDSSEEEIALRKAMFSSAKHKIFLCDHSKLNHAYSFTLCNIREVTRVISNE